MPRPCFFRGIRGLGAFGQPDCPDSTRRDTSSWNGTTLGPPPLTRAGPKQACLEWNLSSTTCRSGRRGCRAGSAVHRRDRRLTCSGVRPRFWRSAASKQRPTATHRAVCMLCRLFAPTRSAAWIGTTAKRAGTAPATAPVSIPTDTSCTDRHPHHSSDENSAKPGSNLPPGSGYAAGLRDARWSGCRNWEGS